ncbi:MAG: hypothetical protein EAX96_19815, partial [Candidatus Lokiarchaeota archaeon]|nr:hypothetical protein [Candidatus Lokiarchaeota archaeon]
ITWIEKGIVNQSGIYLNGSIISFNVDGLPAGTYNFRIAVNDTSGNSASYDVMVNVTESTNPTTPPPIPGFSLEILILTLLSITFAMILKKKKNQNVSQLTMKFFFKLNLS